MSAAGEGHEATAVAGAAGADATAEAVAAAAASAVAAASASAAPAVGGEAGGIACGKKIPSPKSSVRVALTAPSEGGETHTTCPSLSERGGCGVSGGRLVSVGTLRTVDSLAPSLSSSTVHEGRSVASTRGAEGGGGGANGGGGDGGMYPRAHTHITWEDGTAPKSMPRIVTGVPPAVGPAIGCMAEARGRRPQLPERGGEEAALGGRSRLGPRRWVAPPTSGPRKVATAMPSCGDGACVPRRRRTRVV